MLEWILVEVAMTACFAIALVCLAAFVLCGQPQLGRIVNFIAPGHPTAISMMSGFDLNHPFIDTVWLAMILVVSLAMLYADSLLWFRACELAGAIFSMWGVVGVAVIAVVIVAATLDSGRSDENIPRNLRPIS